MSTYTTVIGRLAKSPEAHKVGEQGITKVVLRIASSDSRRDPSTQQWVDGESLFVTVNCWRVLGQNVLALSTGDPVIVHGRLRSREWTNAAGERRYATEIDATAVGPDLGKCVVSSMQRLRAQPPAARAENATDGGSSDAEPAPGTFSGSITESLTGGDQRVPESV